jgi:hypothetical protein
VFLSAKNLRFYIIQYGGYATEVDSANSALRELSLPALTLPGAMT